SRTSWLHASPRQKTVGCGQMKVKLIRRQISPRRGSASKNCPVILSEAKDPCTWSRHKCWRPKSYLSRRVFSPRRIHCRHQRTPQRNDCALGWIGGGRGPRQHLVLDVLHELLDLPAHLLHALPHLQNDGHAADIDPQIACQRQDELQPLQIFIGIKPGIAFGAAGLEQPFAFVKAQSLRMNLIHLGYGRDHVRALGFTLGHILEYSSRPVMGAIRTKSRSSAKTLAPCSSAMAATRVSIVLDVMPFPRPAR